MRNILCAIISASLAMLATSGLVAMVTETTQVLHPTHAPQASRPEPKQSFCCKSTTHTYEIRRVQG